ncbi:MAG: type II toxin-antitoxin system RelE/ParE family toxin [Bacteroidales bacterium]
MAVKVLWTETALKNLEDIFEYYKYNASVTTAKRIVQKLAKSSLLIQNSPSLGRKEELLEGRKFEYRFLIVENYKIIYWSEDGYIKIASVFDSRQNPEKIQSI